MQMIKNDVSVQDFFIEFNNKKRAKDYESTDSLIKAAIDHQRLGILKMLLKYFKQYDKIGYYRYAAAQMKTNCIKVFIDELEIPVNTHDPNNLTYLFCCTLNYELFKIVSLEMYNKQIEARRGFIAALCLRGLDVNHYDGGSETLLDHVLKSQTGDNMWLRTYLIKKGAKRSVDLKK